MIQCLLTALASGSGKTVMTCALLAAMRQRGMHPCAFKCGPDYIDPMFHRAVLGVESHNMDLFLCDEDRLRGLFQRCTAGHGAVVCEGVMGFYDGLGGSTDRCSTWQVARTLELPALLVLRPKGTSLTLAAQVNGLRAFRPESGIVGILLNDCSQGMYRQLSQMLRRETGLPVLGFLPPVQDAVIESRHLGLMTAGEIRGLETRIMRLGELLASSLNWEELERLCRRDGDPFQKEPLVRSAGEGIPLAVARDEAFCFLYEENLEMLRAAGAQIVPFSPLRDRQLPPGVGGLYLPGGYPELYARELSENRSMLRAVHRAVTDGLPTVAECGGFLYLGRTLVDAQGRDWPMAGVLPGRACKQERLVRFGYSYLTARADGMLFKAGELLPVHEFHYWDSTDNGEDLEARKPLYGRSWRCGFSGRTLYAAFPHLYFPGPLPLAKRFVEAANLYLRGEKDGSTIEGPDPADRSDR